MNKFITLLVVSFFFGKVGLAQNLQLTFQDTAIVSNANSSAELVGYAYLKNNSGQDMDVMAKRIDKSYTVLTDSNAICWAGGCYIPSISQSPFSLSIPAGATVTDFSAHVYPEGDGVVSAGPIRYVFFDENNPSDSVSFIINFAVTQNFSIEEKFLPTVSVFPNPAKDFLKVELKNVNSNNAQFELIDMLGNRVFSKNIEGQRNFELDLSNVARGIYFYALKQDNITIATKKLVVR